MKCPQCGEAVEPAAAFCGNCGYRLQLTGPVMQDVVPPATIPVGGQQSRRFQMPAPAAAVANPDLSQPAAEPNVPKPAEPMPPPPAPPAAPVASDAPASAAIPAYAVAPPQDHAAHNKAMVGLILAVLSLPGALIPVVGYVLATVGVALAVLARSALSRKAMSTIAIVFATLGYVLSTAAFIYNTIDYNRTHKTGNTTDGSTSASQVDSGQSMSGNSSVKATAAAASKIVATPCYSVATASLGNVDSVADSCKLQMYNNESINSSTDAVTVDPVSQPAITADNLASTGKVLADNYLKAAMPGLTVTTQEAGTFAKSPAYFIRGSATGNVSIVMAIVLHKVDHGENVFVIMHAINDKQADLQQLEKDWVWK